jgi:hypothetical protein
MAPRFTQRKRAGKRGSEQGQGDEGSYVQAGSSWLKQGDATWRKGATAAHNAYARAVECLNESVSRGETGSVVLLARALQKLSETERAASRGKTPLLNARQAETTADANSASRLAGAIEMLLNHGTGAEDACVEEGNARSARALCLANELSSPGEHTRKHEADEELALAERAYRRALELEGPGEEDTDVVINLGDSLRQRCELSSDANHGASADEAYSKAVALLHGRDDLNDHPHVFHDWGCALYAFGNALRENRAPKEGADVLSRAESKLRDAASHDPTDIEAFVALGETLVARAECQSEQAQRAEELQRAEMEGFKRALTIDRNDVNAITGMAEAELAKAREAITGAGEQARLWYSEAMRAEPVDVGGWKERAEVMYNLACACSIAGVDFDGAAIALKSAINCGAATAEEASADEELASLLNGSADAARAVVSKAQ